MDMFGKEDLSSSNPSLVASIAAAAAAAAALRIETESTLSNITSLQSQSQSLYDSDTPSNQHLTISNQHISRKSIDDEHHVVVVHNNNNNNNLTSSHKAIHKKSSMPSSSSQQQQQQPSLYGGYSGGVSDDASTIDTFDGIIAPPNSIVGNFTDGPAVATGNCAATTTSAGVSGASVGATGAFVAPTTPINTNNVVNSNKTATILVSKTKTKTGLPLLLKNSIKN